MVKKRQATHGKQRQTTLKKIPNEPIPVFASISNRKFQISDRQEAVRRDETKFSHIKNYETKPIDRMWAKRDRQPMNAEINTAYENYQTKPILSLPCPLPTDVPGSRTRNEAENYQTNPTFMDHRFQIPDLRWGGPLVLCLSASAVIDAFASKHPGFHSSFFCPRKT